MSIDLLKDDIKNKNIRNLYLFYGPEEYLKKYYLESVEDTIVSKDLKSLNMVMMEGKVDQGKIIDNCETLPVFSDRKLVIVKNSGLFKSGSKKNPSEVKDKARKNDLIEYLQNIPSQTCLVFYEEEADKKLKILETVRKKGLVVEFPLQKSSVLLRWINRVLKADSKTIDSQGAARLVENCEQGMNELLNEINKLIQFTGERNHITDSDVEMLCVKSIKSRIFDLTDAISEKNANKALKLLEEMIILKEPLPKILFMITRHFRQMMELKLYIMDGCRPEELASKMGISPYAVGKIRKQVPTFAVDTLKQAVFECLEYDVGIKTGKINDRVAVELLITRYSKK